MGLLDYVATPPQRVAYMFPEMTGTAANPTTFLNRGRQLQSRESLGLLRDVFVFQFWPQQIQDNYTPNYATKNIPGASHPLYQWVSGNGRDISFSANFVSEVHEDVGLGTDNSRDFRTRIQQSTATNNTAVANTGINAFVSALLLPSARYTVNVSSALAALQQYLYPTYDVNSDGSIRPPKKLVLVLPGTNLGRDDGDGILCILRSASVTMESWFPSGELRAATVALRFSEIIQHSTGGDVSQIKYIGAEKYKGLAEAYQSTITDPNGIALA